MAADQDQLIAWLSDACAMEYRLIPILETHAKESADRDARSRMLAHVEETRRHAARVRECIEQLGGSVSIAKTGLSILMGGVEGMATSMFMDRAVKNALMDYASEHFEIACYTALATAAEAAGKPKIAKACREILEEEQAMARWLESQLPNVVEDALAARRHG
jgi:ferritin-like metal-binding protein YciE